MASCYGKLPPKIHPQAPRLARYLATNIVAPQSCYYGTKVTDWSVLMNDRIGDCVPCAGLHLLQSWGNETGKPFSPTDDQALVIYEALAGYNPSTGANDNGVDISAFLDYWQNTGVAGNDCVAHAVVDHTNLDLIKLGIYLFGGVIVGTEVTSRAEAQTDAHVPWDDTWYPSFVQGLHGIPLLGYDSRNFWACSWGQMVAITPEYALRHFDEAHVVIDPTWILASGVSPSGVNLQGLIADQSLVA